MLTKNLPITRDTKILRNLTIDTTANFSKRFKYTVGDRMIDVVLDLNKCIRRANEEEDNVRRLYYIKELRYLIEDFEDLLDTCLEHKVVSVKQVASIAEVLDSIGKQSTGWINYTKKNIK